MFDVDIRRVASLAAENKSSYTFAFNLTPILNWNDELHRRHFIASPDDIIFSTFKII